MPARPLFTALLALTLLMSALAPARAANLPGSPAAPWREIDTSLATIAPGVSFIAAEVVDGDCQPIHGYQADTTLAVASSFKLYVLGAIARAVANGTLQWDDPVVIRDDLRSLPSGNLRYWAAGSQLPLSDVVNAMIANSDNTATDHLIALVGREAVEDEMTAMGHRDPLLNQPLLMTREWFALRMRFTPEQIAGYLDLSPSERRVYLERVVDPVADTLTEYDIWPGPIFLDQLEWLASAGDLCRAMAALHQISTDDEQFEVRTALGLNPSLA